MPRLTKTSFMSRVAAFARRHLLSCIRSPRLLDCGVCFSSRVLFRPGPFSGPSIVAEFAFGVGKYLFGASWIYVSIREYGGAGIFLASFLVALFVMDWLFFCCQWDIA